MSLLAKKLMLNPIRPQVVRVYPSVLAFVFLLERYLVPVVEASLNRRMVTDEPALTPYPLYHAPVRVVAGKRFVSMNCIRLYHG